MAGFTLLETGAVGRSDSAGAQPAPAPDSKLEILVVDSGAIIKGERLECLAKVSKGWMQASRSLSMSLLFAPNRLLNNCLTFSFWGGSLLG